MESMKFGNSQGPSFMFKVIHRHIFSSLLVCLFVAFFYFPAVNVATATHTTVGSYTNIEYGTENPLFCTDSIDDPVNHSDCVGVPSDGGLAELSTNSCSSDGSYAVCWEELWERNDECFALSPPRAWNWARYVWRCDASVMPTVSASMSVSPSIVDAGNDATFTLTSSAGVTRCDARYNGGSWFDPGVTSGDFDETNITSPVTWEARCYNADGSHNTGIVGATVHVKTCTVDTFNDACSVWAGGSNPPGIPATHTDGNFSCNYDLCTYSN